MESNLFTTVLLPLALASIMLGMGLGLVPEDFRRIGRDPTAVIAGTLSQMVALPLIGALIVWWVPMPPAIAVGLLVVAICPGGPSSNLITYLAKGDVALSVSLTALSSLLTVVTIPVLANLALRVLMGAEAAIALPLGTTMVQILLITLVPIAGGMALRQRWPATALRLERQVSRLAVGLLALIILLLLVREGGKLPEFIWKVGLGVVLLNGLGTLAGYGTGRLLGLPVAQQISLAVEVGIQNCTLAIAITAGLLRDPEMAVPAALYGLWMNVSGLAVVRLGRRARARLEGQPAPRQPGASG
ncbi:MAG: bile acid:sodium symporter family protein [Cyanobacteriota bacterium]|nr:bile acid:sodium symporter family protein [Cyanobacteriota bacterium]